MRKLTVTLTQEEVTEALARVARDREGLTFSEAKVHLEVNRRRRRLPWCDEIIDSVDVVFEVKEEKADAQSDRGDGEAQ